MGWEVLPVQICYGVPYKSRFGEGIPRHDDPQAKQNEGNLKVAQGQVASGIIVPRKLSGLLGLIGICRELLGFIGNCRDLSVIVWNCMIIYEIVRNCWELWDGRGREEARR